jgi:molybdopterin-guanine dinucleotide biosynthesis protein A
MGFDKTQLVVDGVALAVRTADTLRRVVTSAVEVGPGLTGLMAVREETPGAGPLAAVSAGWEVLGHGGYSAALVVAADLPFVSERLLRLLAEWASPLSVVPVVDGRDQPLCARWSREDLDQARELLASGERSLRHLSNRIDVEYIDESGWGSVATWREFADVDTPEDLRRYAIGEPSPPETTD